MLNRYIIDTLVLYKTIIRNNQPNKLLSKKEYTIQFSLAPMESIEKFLISNILPPFTTRKLRK